MFPIKPKHSSTSSMYKYGLGTNGAKSHQNDLKPRKLLFPSLILLYLFSNTVVSVNFLAS